MLLERRFGMGCKSTEVLCRIYEGNRKEIFGLGSTPREAFAHLINKVSRKDVWEENPYVFVYDFELINNHSLR